MTGANPDLFPEGMAIDKWSVVRHIGHGGYGEIYQVVGTSGEGPYAMKIEMRDAKKRGMYEEIRFLKNLQGSPCFPAFIESGETPEFRYFVMELLGPSVSAIRRALPGQRLSAITATAVAKSMLKCIEELHRRGFVHRDIKPGNFLLRNDSSQMICMIDFGLSRRYTNKKTGMPLPSRGNVGFIGTCSFASVNAHDGKDLGRRDDLISWIYTIVEAVEKRLPWPGSKDRAQTVMLKKEITPGQLCRSLPVEFTTILKKVMKYSFLAEPEYDLFYRMLDDAMEKLGGSREVFDWERLPKEKVKTLTDLELPHNPLRQQTDTYESEEEEAEEEEVKEDEAGPEPVLEPEPEIQPEPEPEPEPEPQPQPEPEPEPVKKQDQNAKGRSNKKSGEGGGGCCSVA